LVHGIGGEMSKLGRIADPEGFYRALINVADSNPVNARRQIQHETDRPDMQRIGFGPKR
jgi:hypothetical protein